MKRDLLSSRVKSTNSRQIFLSKDTKETPWIYSYSILWQCNLTFDQVKHIKHFPHNPLKAGYFQKRHIVFFITFMFNKSRAARRNGLHELAGDQEDPPHGWVSVWWQLEWVDWVATRQQRQRKWHEYNWSWLLCRSDLVYKVRQRVNIFFGKGASLLSAPGIKEKGYATRDWRSQLSTYTFPLKRRLSMQVPNTPCAAIKQLTQVKHMAAAD